MGRRADACSGEARSGTDRDHADPPGGHPPQRRSDPGNDLTEALAAFARSSAVTRLKLDGLGRTDVAEFIARSTGLEASVGVLSAVWDRTDGNPFFVSELARLLAGENALTDERAGPLPLPPGVRDVVRHRLNRLPEATRALLNTASVAGPDFDLRVVASACGLDGDVGEDLIDSAVALGLVVEPPAASSTYRFSHDLVRDAVYAGVTGLRRARLHARMADASQHAGLPRPSPSELAHHYRAAWGSSDPRRP